MSSSFRLGSWVVHPELNALTHTTEEESPSVEEIRVEPRVMQVLLYLAQHPGEVISREQFLEAVWNGVYVSDEVLTNAVKELRKALGDDPKSPRFIQTVPKKGYRLIAPVSREGVETWTGPPLERNPYPGLAPFSESDAGLFFGREDEVETLLEKLSQHHLLALIGPSGVGKSSLLRAGLLPSLPGNWQAVVCHPGERPFSSLAEALVSELPGDTESTKQLLRFDDIDVAISVLRQWRQKHQEILVIVDQFEELFTLSPMEIQSRFSELLGRAGTELGIHVLLSMRDDFLIHCHDHPALAPVFRDLTPLKSPTGDALRRALVEPPRLRGYRFEEESLVDEMLEEVSEERGALPLLSFAAARLWEKRDRENLLLIRSAYGAIGGVSGALAQRAEEILEGLGTERHETVREIFRNLITAKGTRASRDLEELLSVFADREDAQTVLNRLIDARLLTSFELPSRESQPASHRIELIHESLLSHWPRLVRWQAQDAEGALLRDQLRQAAQIWNEHNRTEDLLWTGTAFREFRLWRERYSGGLTATEEAFAQAMVERATRQRRRKRWAVASIIMLLLGGLAVVGVSRQQAISQARRAEASRLVALGRLEMDRYPTATLAYVRKSLEVADTFEARKLALEALWRGPTARILPVGHNGAWRIAFSPDGRRLAARTFSENMLIFPEGGGTPVVIGGFETPTGPRQISFTPEGDALLTMQYRAAERRRSVRTVSVPGGQEIRIFAPPVDSPHWLWEALPHGILFGVPEATDNNLLRFEVWPYDGGPPQAIGALRKPTRWVANNSGTQLALYRGKRIFVRPLAGPVDSPEREIATTVGEGRRFWLRFSPQDDWLAVGADTGQLTLWPLDPDTPHKPRILNQDKPEYQFPLEFDAEGSRLVWGSLPNDVSLWHLDGPLPSEPVVLKRGTELNTKQGVFHPDGDWLAVANHYSVTFWATRQPQPFVLRGYETRVWRALFTHDSKWLISCGRNDSVRVLPLDPQVGTLRTISLEGVNNCNALDVCSNGAQILLGGFGGARLISSSGSEARQLMRRPPDGGIYGVALDHSERQVALSTAYSAGPPKKIRVWDLESIALVRELPLAPPGESEEGYDWGVWQLAFTPDGELIAAGEQGIRRFDTETGEYEWIWRVERGRNASMGMSRDGRWLLATAFTNEGTGAKINPVVLFDLAKGTKKAITSHGNRVVAVALDSAGTLVVTGDEQFDVRNSAMGLHKPPLQRAHTGSRWAAYHRALCS